MAEEPYVSAKFKVTATFQTTAGPVVFDDVIAVSASFALNTIPTASLVVAVGKNALTGELATIHTAQAKLQPRDKVVVKLQVIHGAGDAAKYPSGTYTIFDGFFVGIGYQRSQNQANFVLHLTHWLDDLNNSSAVNGTWFPSVPFDYAQSALYDRVSSVESYHPTPTVAAEFASPANAETDLWELVIKKLFKRLSGYGGGLVQESNKDAATNNSALDALERMPGEGAAYYKALRLKLGAIFGSNLSNSFAQYFTDTIGTDFVQNTFWAKLVSEYAASFFFAISPAVKWALPIPFCAGLRWPATGGKLIRANEYNYANFNSSMSQLIRSVELAYASTDRSGLPEASTQNIPGDLPRSFYYPCGVFPSKTADAFGRKQIDKGLRLFKLPPKWALNTDAAPFCSYSSTVNAQAATAPDSDGNALPPPVKPPNAAALAIQPSMSLFAQHWYVTEVLQQRYGELSGPLRFDIAPGSIVKIITPARDIKLNAEAEEYVVAAVMSVSYVINAERATAGTSFSIAHTKIKRELQADSVYAVSAPPLYEEPWFGGPLAEPENN